MNQIINFSLTNEKVQTFNKYIILMNLKVLLNTQMIWMILIKILKNIIQIKIIVNHVNRF